MALPTTKTADDTSLGAIPENIRLADNELFLQKAFEQNPSVGFELLFRRYYSPLHSHATRILYSREVAEDVVNDVFMNFWQKEAYLNITISFRAYLFVSVRHAAHAHLRRDFLQEQVSLTEAMDIQSTVLSADKILQYDELYLCIDQAVKAMPNQMQRVFILSRFEGKKHREIADLLNIAPKTVEVHIHKALKIIKEIVARQ